MAIHKPHILTSVPRLASRLRLTTKLIGDGLAISTFKVLLLNTARLIVQLAWVIVLARTLGAHGYGEFSGVAGLALSISGLVGAGLGLRMYQDVAREPSALGVRWAQASRTLWWTAIALWMLFVALGTTWFSHVAIVVIALIAAAELVATPMAMHVAFAYSAKARMGDAAAVPVLMSLARLLAALALMGLTSEPDMRAYAFMHMTTTLLCAWLLWIRCWLVLRPDRSEAVLEPGALREGATLSAVWTTGLALTSLDKALALRLGTADLAGHYAAASRFATLLMLPMDALMTAVLPRLFRAGRDQGRSLRSLSWLPLAALAYGMAAGLVLWSCVELVPSLLGRDFDLAVPALEILALYVPAYSMRVLAANILLGFGWRAWRLACEFVALVCLALLMALLIPASGLQGAAWAAVITESLLAAILWVRAAPLVFRGKVQDRGN